MILQSLVNLYEELVQAQKLPPLGWSNIKISYCILLDREGNIKGIKENLQEVIRGKKTILVPESMELPSAVKRSSGIAPNFLWDNSTYILGIDGKGKPERSEECFHVCARFHIDLLKEIKSPIATAIVQFFKHWDVSKAAENEFIHPHLDDLYKGGNLTFCVENKYVYEDPEIREAWIKHYESADGVRMRCLVTGKEDVIALIHPSIHGVAGAQSSGAALVSFNSSAVEYESGGNLRQGLNAPIGRYAAFAYTSALNYLLAQRDYVQRIGDTTIVCWTDGAESQYQDFTNQSIFGEAAADSDDDPVMDVYQVVQALSEGKPCQDLNLDPNKKFYILGLAPNAARISVRFFYQNSFGTLMKNVHEHFRRMEIIKPKNDRYEHMPLWMMFSETVNKNTTDKMPNPVMSGAMMRSIFTGEPYPASLIQTVMLRIRAEHNVTRGKAAIIKAYYLKNKHEECPEEVLTVALNEESRNTAYILGRLFSVYQAAQENVYPGLNATIKDKYINSASATPANIFPVLDNLYQKHLRKMSPGTRVYFDRQVTELKGALGEEYPLRLTLPQQGSFNLGFYHQTQKRYTKREEI